MFLLHKPCFQLLKLVFFSWPLLGEYSYKEEKCTFKSHSGTRFTGQHIYAEFKYYILYENEVNFL